MELVLS